MKRSCLSAYGGFLIVGVVATLALLLEIRLPVPQDIHFLLQFLWVGVAMSGLFVAMLHPAINSHTPADFGATLQKDDIPEWHDPDRVWMQQQPDEWHLANDIDKEEG